jgi:hypothetical protein
LGIRPVRNVSDSSALGIPGTVYLIPKQQRAASLNLRRHKCHDSTFRARPQSSAKWLLGRSRIRASSICLRCFPAQSHVLGNPSLCLGCCLRGPLRPPTARPILTAFRRVVVCSAHLVWQWGRTWACCIRPIRSTHSLGRADTNHTLACARNWRKSGSRHFLVARRSLIPQGSFGRSRRLPTLAA